MNERICLHFHAVVRRAVRGVTGMTVQVGVAEVVVLEGRRFCKGAGRVSFHGRRARHNVWGQFLVERRIPFVHPFIRDQLLGRVVFGGNPF